MAKPNVGYIGLGSAGYPMAACLAKKGYRLVVHDRDPAPARRFVQEFPGCRRALEGAVVGDAFAGCDIVITMLPDGNVVREALLGENGIARGMQPGMYLPYAFRPERLLIGPGPGQSPRTSADHMDQKK